MEDNLQMPNYCIILNRPQFYSSTNNGFFAFVGKRVIVIVYLFSEHTAIQQSNSEYQTDNDRLQEKCMRAMSSSRLGRGYIFEFCSRIVRK